MKTKYEVGDYLITTIKSSIGPKGSIFQVHSIVIEADGIYYRIEGRDLGLKESCVRLIKYEVVDEN